MRERLIRAPWWVQALITGTLFWVIRVVNDVIGGRDLDSALLHNVVGSVLFGLLLGLASARSNRRYLTARGDLTKVQRGDLKQAMRRGGPVPTDPRVREAAIRVVDYRVRQQRYLLWWAVPLYAVLIAMSVWLAITDNPAWLVAGLGFAALVSWAVVVRRRTLERQRVLAA